MYDGTRFSSLWDRTEAKELTQEAASELPGISVRTFQRWAERFEAGGDDGLVDRRMARRSSRHAPQEELERTLGLAGEHNYYACSEIQPDGGQWPAWRGSRYQPTDNRQVRPRLERP